jgi:hypothetical protein
MNVALAQQDRLLVPRPLGAATADVINPANVKPNTPVITLNGHCDHTSVIGTIDKESCRTIVTRSQFEQLAKGSSVDSSGPIRVKFASSYAKFARLADEAQKRGMDKDPRFQEKFELARIQLLGQMLIQDLQAKSKQYSPDELQRFFRENPVLFEQAAIQRVYIPGTKFTNLLNSVQQPIPESAPEMKFLAEAIYARAKTGADFKTLEKEALQGANLREEPVTDLGKMARSQLRQTHRDVFDLKPGEVSTLFEEPGEGYYIYKMGDKEMPSFEAVKSETASAFEKQRMDAWIDSIMGSAHAELNEEYFGSGANRTAR